MGFLAYPGLVAEKQASMEIHSVTRCIAERDCLPHLATRC